jgi:hypothetical protein
MNVDFRPTSTGITGDEASVTAAITWQEGDAQKEIEASFRLQPSPYYGWVIVQTSLLDTLLANLD